MLDREKVEKYFYEEILMKNYRVRISLDLARKLSGFADDNWDAWGTMEDLPTDFPGFDPDEIMYLTILICFASVVGNTLRADLEKKYGK